MLDLLIKRYVKFFRTEWVVISQVVPGIVERKPGKSNSRLLLKLLKWTIRWSFRLVFWWPFWITVYIASHFILFIILPITVLIRWVAITIINSKHKMISWWADKINNFVIGIEYFFETCFGLLYLSIIKERLSLKWAERLEGWKLRSNRFAHYCRTDATKDLYKLWIFVKEQNSSDAKKVYNGSIVLYKGLKHKIRVKIALWSAYISYRKDIAPLWARWYIKVWKYRGAVVWLYLSDPIWIVFKIRVILIRSYYYIIIGLLVIKEILYGIMLSIAIIMRPFVPKWKKRRLQLVRPWHKIKAWVYKWVIEIGVIKYWVKKRWKGEKKR